MNRLLIIFSLCFAMAFGESEQEVPERLQNITCLNSTLVVEEMSRRTYLKIMSDAGEILFDVNSDNTKMWQLQSFVGDLVTVLFPENLKWLPKWLDHSTDYYIAKRQLEDGRIEVLVKDKFGRELTGKFIPELAGIEPRRTCARILQFNLVIGPEWDINRLDGFNMTSLIWSCYLGSTDLAKRLVERGADVNQQGWHSTTPLLTAIITSRDELVEFLIQKGARVEGGEADITPLGLAVRIGSLNVVRTLLEHGALVNATDEKSPLLFAADTGRLELIDLLLKKGANISAANKQGQTALHLAVWRRAEDIIDRLTEAGADVNAKDSDGETPLMYAVSRFSEEDISLHVVQHLLNHHNPDVNVRNKAGQTALSIAAEQGYSKVQELLKSKGAI